VNICVDAMGGDNAPHAIVEGSITGLNRYKDINLVLVGKKEAIEEQLAKYQYDQTKVIVHDAREIIGMAEKPVDAIKRKKDSSMVKGFELLRDGECDVFITAGSTGAALAGATLIVRRIKGILRPALCPVLPTEKGGVILVDCGANVDCKPSYLAQFGLMGSIYMKSVMGVKNPRVGLINNGIEEEKGNLLTKAAYPLLKEQKGINFKGNVEGRDILGGDYDVVVADGFSGNIVLKFMEGVAKTLMSMLKTELMADTKSKIGALLSKPAYKRFKKRMDYTEHGGALLLGVKGGVIKSHGSSDAKTIASTIRQAREFIITDVVGGIKEEIAKQKK
jgi:phosphate acyltransferase